MRDYTWLLPIYYASKVAPLLSTLDSWLQKTATFKKQAIENSVDAFFQPKVYVG